MTTYYCMGPPSNLDAQLVLVRSQMSTEGAEEVDPVYECTRM